MLELLKKWLEPIEAKHRTCACCGRCCELFGGHLHAYDADIRRWKRDDREDLLQMVNHLGWIWVDPVTKAPLDRCPFIYRSESELSLCQINDTKPDMCREYPRIEYDQHCVRKPNKEN